MLLHRADLAGHKSLRWPQRIASRFQFLQQIANDGNLRLKVNVGATVRRFLEPWLRVHNRDKSNLHTGGCWINSNDGWSFWQTRDQLFRDIMHDLTFES